jgi:hypothetical protein
MTKKGYILILMFLSWPINNIHRLWNNSPSHVGNWYLFDHKYTEDIQWYVHDVCQCVSYLLIFISIWLWKDSSVRRDKSIMVAFESILINQALDLIHYVGWHRRNEYILLLEGVIITYAALKIFIKPKKI